ncbi:MAG: cytochrome c peroxidase [Myxococcales bacterium]|nr:hypothetical protein [Polyangiaceae bacterium]MDW8250158.1 cytochrome c peroxidase [Myxococcales bacterium]
MLKESSGASWKSRFLTWALLPLLACGDSSSPSFSGSAGAAANPANPCALWSAPTGDNLDATLPNLPVRPAPGRPPLSWLHQLRSGCDQPRLLVLRVEPAWCGPCGLRADRTAALLAPFAGEHLAVETLLYAGPDNAPTTDDDMLAWKEAHASLPGGLLRPDGGDAGMLVRGHGTVPMIYLVDARTLRIVQALEAPDDWFLQKQVAESLVEVGGPTIQPPPLEEPPLRDGFDAFSWALIEQMAAPWEPPPDPSNAFADDPAAAKLGEDLFNDPALAGNHGVSCASCHEASKGFADGRATAKGVTVGTFNTPTAFASLQRWFFWDGRADSLWAQALGPLENPSETGGSRLHVAHRVGSVHRSGYEAIFGPLPPLEDPARFPPEGKPGDPAFDAMAPADQEAITQVFVRVGKAIAAYERTLRPPPTRLSAYVAGDFEALTPLERAGLHVFLRSGCVNCHHGPALSDGAFHNILMPSSGGSGDRGRIDGVATLLSSPFRKDGPYSDDPGTGARLAALRVVPEMLGQVKTPTLRNVARTGPWGHGGTFSTLEGVVAHYGQVFISGKKPLGTVGERDPALGGFLGGHAKELVAFLKVLGE